MIVDGQPTYKCWACKDSGLANVWNPRFVESYREEFASVTRKEGPRKPEERVRIGSLKMLAFDLDRYDTKGEITAWRYDPPNWEWIASRWWRNISNGNGGPIHHVALCNCQCERKLRLENELHLFLSGNREIKETSTGKMKKLGMPACGRAKYNPEKMPLNTFCSFDDLAGWYATHQVNEIYAWQP